MKHRHEEPSPHIRSRQILISCGLCRRLILWSSNSSFAFLKQGALVFMMQAGFAMLCAGSIRQKNVKNIMLKNILDASFGAIGFFTLGYGFSYGGDSSDVTFVGNSLFGLKGMDTSAYASFFFQFAFAASAATIVAGTVSQ
jgi:ammonium transporter, Amt family